MRKLFTSESVTEGHPDKVCDIISDAVLDEYLAADCNARVACETMATTDNVFIMGEITSDAKVDVEGIVRKTVKEIGYDGFDPNFSYDKIKVNVYLDKQSPDIAMGVDSSLEHKNGGGDFDRLGAGDQGMMFGFATDETENCMPSALNFAHKLTEKLTLLRKSNELPYLKPDGKAQVTVIYEDGKVVGIDSVVVSTQHDENIDLNELKKDITNMVIKAVFPSRLINGNTKIYINPTGRFVVGGPHGDSGLTGRKIIVDTYGGFCPHGGGAFSGKDPTKVDRSAAYMARYVCKNVVAAGLAKKCEIQLAYAIGVAKPVSVFVDTFNTGVYDDEKLTKIICKNFDFRPMAIIEKFSLKRPIYKETASNGHFGKCNFPWEQTDSVGKLKKYLKD